MLRLDNDVGFKVHFSQSWIDPLLRLDEEASNEKAYKLYKRHLEIGYDPTEGVIKMEVTATNPTVSKQYAEALIAYSEEKVDNLSRRKRNNQDSDAKKRLKRPIKNGWTQRKGCCVCSRKMLWSTRKAS